MITGGITLALNGMIALSSQAWLPMVVGTYTASDSEGIYTYRFNQETGQAEKVIAIEATNPSFLAFSPDGKTVYAVNESGKPDDSVVAFRYDSPERVARLNEMETGGEAPCNLLTTANLVISSNYTGGSLTVFRADADGSLAARLQTIEFPLTGPAPDTVRQQGAHLHCAALTPDGSRLIASDLGNDCLYVFTIDPAADKPLTLAATVAVAAGAGPRHLTFSPDGRFLYAITELSGEVMAFSYSDGALSLVQTVRCDDVRASGSADIHLTPDGRFLYASNRLKNDGIAIFSVDEATGKLTRAGFQPTGVHPRNFAITPNGKFLLCACRDSDLIQVFEIDSQTGGLTDTKSPIRTPMPVCVTFTK